MPLGSLLGPLEALLGGLKSEKMPTVPRENHFFINTGLWFFEDPNGPLGLILVPLGQIWSQNGSQHGCKFDQKVGQPFIKKIEKMGALLGIILGFNFSLFRDRRAKAFSTIDQIMLICFIDFESHFGTFGCLLGAFLGFLRFSWEVSGPKNVKKLVVF